MDYEGCSDIQIKARVNDGSKNSDAWFLTDTHWRCQDGVGSFNYRLKIPCLHDPKSDELTLRVEAWDRDIVASNDAIGGFNLDLRAMRDDVMATRKKMVLHTKYWDDYLK
jgi:hypothetical protein